MAKSSLIFRPQPTPPAPAPASSSKAVEDWESEGGSVPHPTHEQIAKRAYEIYLKSGRLEGRCRINWEQAEQELQDQMQKNRPQAQKPASAIRMTTTRGQQ